MAVLAVPAHVALGVLGAALAVSLAVRAARSVRIRRQRRRLATPVPGEILLGVDSVGRAIRLSEAQLSAHGLILGASGAGKSTTLLSILAAEIHQGRPVVALDLKGSPAFAATLREAAQAAGRPFRCWTPDGPESWNPLAHGNATELKDKLISTERFTEPHYQRAAERYVQTALQVLQESAPDRPVTLERVVRMLEPARLAVAARSLPGERAGRVVDYLASLTPDQLSAVRGFAARLAIISESHTGAFLGDQNGLAIDLRGALSGEEIVLFSLNSSRYGRLSAQLGTLAVQDLVGAAGHRLSTGAAGEATAVVGIDEFSALGSDNIIALLARGREAGVSVLLATQELADLDRSARGLRDQVLGNTAVKIAHRQDVPASAETIARLAGTEKDWEPTYALRPGRWGGVDVRQGTLRQVDRFLVEPDRVRTLGTGEAVLIVKTPRAGTRLTRILPARERDDGPARG